MGESREAVADVTLDIDPPEPALLERFRRELASGSVRRIRGEDAWRAFGRALTGSPPRPSEGGTERELYVAALRELERRSVIRLPSLRGRGWDRSITPASPRSLDLLEVATAASPASDERWRTFPWHPNLDWVRELRSPSDAHLEFLHRVHRALVEGALAERAPAKYRSLQLTGHEKGLKQLARSSLFGHGRLSLEKLGCMPEVLPLAWEQVGPRKRMLIFENAASFFVARNVLLSLADPPYGLIAYGAGRSFVGSIAHLSSIDVVPSDIEYVGDIDVPGLGIARAAQKRAERLGLPVITPATTMHAAMLASAAKLGAPEGWKDKKRSLPVSRVMNAAKFVDEAVRADVLRILSAGRRVPEETLGPDELRRAFTTEPPSATGLEPR